MTNIYGYLVQCDGRELFIRKYEDVVWAFEDANYTVTPLVAQTETVDIPESLEKGFGKTEGFGKTDEFGKTDPQFEDYVAISSQLYQIQQDHIAQLQKVLEDAVELIETINEFSSSAKEASTSEMKGTLHLVAESCAKFLKSQEE